MTQTAIPYLFMRGGTSRGPYFKREDLPADRDHLAQVLIAAVGSGHRLNIDGIGGGVAVTTKVAMLSKSEDPWADVDYFFAQVSVEDRRVDFKPTCGNILSGVGAAAIEMGIVAPSAPTTQIKIRAVNTGAKVVAEVMTPGGVLTYDGEAKIAGVPGTAAPVQLQFMGVVGAATGKFLPTGKLQDVVDGVAVTCMDVAMPMVIARASDLGMRGDEGVGELEGNREFFTRIERLRVAAAKKMGMGDVTKSVVPKFGMVAAARYGGDIAARYFMPWEAHPSMAVTGGQCLAACALTPDSVAYDLLVDEKKKGGSPSRIQLEHASGTMEVVVEYETGDGEFKLHSAGILRTARKLADGNVYVPKNVWEGK